MAVPIRNYRIAAIPGDGIGMEVVDAALRVVQAAAEVSGKYRIEITNFPWGTAYYKKTGAFLPTDFQNRLKQYDAVLFGAVGYPGKWKYTTQISIDGVFFLIIVVQTSLTIYPSGVSC